MRFVLAFVWLDLIQDVAFRAVARIIAGVALLGLGTLCRRVYQRLRRPGSPEFVGQWKVPGGRRIVLALILAVVSCFIISLMQDPLAIFH